MALSTIILTKKNTAIKDVKDFIEEHPDRSIFQTIEAFEVFLNTKKHKPFFVIAKENGLVVGSVLAVVIHNGIGIKRCFSRRCVVYGNPLIKYDKESVLDVLLKALYEHIKNKAIYAQIRLTTDVSDVFHRLYHLNGFLYEAHLNIFHYLNKTIEDQWNAIHSGRRKNIRRAIANGLVFKEIACAEELNISCNLLYSTYRRIKLPLAHNSLFYTAHEHLQKKEMLKVFVACYNDQIIATRMVLLYNGTVYDWYAGADDNHLDKYPNDFMVWKTIEWATNNGFARFDFGGAGKPGVPYGVREFKLKFGGDVVEQGRIIRILHKPLYWFGKTIISFLKKNQ